MVVKMRRSSRSQEHMETVMLMMCKSDHGDWLAAVISLEGLDGAEDDVP